MAGCLLDNRASSFGDVDRPGIHDQIARIRRRESGESAFVQPTSIPSVGMIVGAKPCAALLDPARFWSSRCLVMRFLPRA
jgi:hypothetical protein